MTPRLSIIIPTTGRPSLARALASLAPAGIGPEDEVIVVADGPEAWRLAEPQVLATPCGSARKVAFDTPHTGDSGNVQRQRGLALADGSHVLFFDDDDALAPGALDAIRGAIIRYPDRPLVFRMRRPDGRVLPGPDNRIDPDLDEDGAVIRGRIGTPCLVAPRDHRLARWGTGYCADQGYIHGTLANWAPVEPVFLPTVTTLVADDERGWGSVYMTTCLTGHVDDDAFLTWLRFTGGTRAGDVIEDMPPRRKAVDVARNKAVAKFLADPTLAHCDSLLFVDNDMVFGPCALEALRSDPAGWPYDVLGGLYRARETGMHLVLRERETLVEGEPPFDVMGGWVPGMIVDVDVVPMGFTLIRRRVLEARRERWFYSIRGTGTEDVGFSRDADQAGFRLGIHTGVGLGHIGSVILNPYDDMPKV